MARPLFIPLCSWAFDLFAAREKTVEYRVYGPRWNERTCAPGRAVTVSKGYGLHHRLVGVVRSFQRLPFPPDPEAWARAYPNGPANPEVAAITLDLRAALHIPYSSTVAWTPPPGWLVVDAAAWDAMDDHSAFLESFVDSARRVASLPQRFQGVSMSCRFADEAPGGLTPETLALLKERPCPAR